MNSNEKANALAKKENTIQLTADQISPQTLEFMAMKRAELGINFDPNLKPVKAKRVDISQIPDYVPLSLSDIEKLSPGNGKYFSGINLVQRDEFTFQYYSWCVPYPSPSKPWFEWMGSSQSSNISMTYMEMTSIHYLNWNFLAGWLRGAANCSSLLVEDWYEQASPPYLWEVEGTHYGFNAENPYVVIGDYSYANDGSQ